MTKVQGKKIPWVIKQLNKALGLGRKSKKVWDILSISKNTANIEKYHCKDGWIKNGDACYLFETEKKYGVSWYGAKEFCESKGGFLADVLNQETQDFINKRTQQDYHTTDWWLGGNDIQKVMQISLNSKLEC